MAGYTEFTVIPKPNDDVLSGRADFDDRCFQAGVSCAVQGLPRDSGVEYKDKRSQDCFNMGYSLGEYNDRKIRLGSRVRKS